MIPVEVDTGADRHCDARADRHTDPGPTDSDISAADGDANSANRDTICA